MKHVALLGVLLALLVSITWADQNSALTALRAKPRYSSLSGWSSTDLVTAACTNHWLGLDCDALGNVVGLYVRIVGVCVCLGS